MNQELKQKAYQLLVDKIDVSTFEKYLYELVENTELKSNTLLFDFVIINYKSEDYKKELYNHINDYYTNEELLSLKIYENCLKIKEVNNDEDVFSFLAFFSDLYVENSYECDIIHQFYFLNHRLAAIESGFGDFNEEEIVDKTKRHSQKVLSWFEFYKDKEDWNSFLQEFIDGDLGQNENILNDSGMDMFERANYTTENKNGSLLKTIYNSLEGILGLR